MPVIFILGMKDLAMDVSASSVGENRLGGNLLRLSPSMSGDSSCDNTTSMSQLMDTDCPSECSSAPNTSGLMTKMVMSPAAATIAPSMPESVIVKR